MEQQQQLAVRQSTIRSEEQILAILEEYDKSGYNVKEYCEVSDINEATLYSWIKRYRNKPDEQPTLPAGQSGFAPIELVPTGKHPSNDTLK